MQTGRQATKSGGGRSGDGYCTRRWKGRGGPGKTLGIVATDAEDGLQRDNAERCYKLWTVMYGAICDFDDCVVQLALKLGWADDGLGDLSPSSAHAWIVECGETWRELREKAVEAFYETRRDESVEPDRYDPRSWDEIIDDTLHADGECAACQRNLPGGSAGHKKLAKHVALGLQTWDQIATRWENLLRI